MLITAIAVMTLAMAFIIGMIVGGLLAPGGPRLPDAIDLSEVPLLPVQLAAGESVVSVETGYDRVMIVTRSGDGAERRYLLPIEPGQPLRLEITPAS